MSTYFRQAAREWREIHPRVFASDLHRHTGGGGAALFRLAPGAQMPEHNHTTGEQGYVIEGTGMFGDQLLCAGDAFWMEAGERHDVRAVTALVFFAISVPRKEDR